MELSDVYVNDNDLDKFHQNYCRTHWSYQGMACEVKDCGSYIYPTLRKYMRHLHRIHKDHQNLLVCHRCTQNFVKIYSLTRHLQSDHDLLLAVSKEMAAEASVIKKKLTNSSTLQGILFRQYFGKTTTELRRTTRIRQLKRENWRKREGNRSRREQANILPEEECKFQFDRRDWSDRLRNVTVTVGLTESDLNTPCGFFAGPGTLSQLVVIACPTLPQGRFVKISKITEYLTLCEVEVLGYSV
uniref:Uncharacterized protein n=1 Tax=Magallana gigas TaxID=29159 RepID=K1QK99_MAGGI